jgi:uncharacterized protein
MTRAVLVDAGSVVALLERRDHHHGWAVEQLSRLRPPFRTCEALITEALYLLRLLPDAPRALLEMIAEGVVTLPFQLKEQPRDILALIERYANVPMSFADACPVRMSELFPNDLVQTLDNDFRIYRRHRRQKWPLLIPGKR